MTLLVFEYFLISWEMWQNDLKTTICCKRSNQRFWLKQECFSSVEKLSSGIQFLYQFLQHALGVSTGG